MSAVLQTQTAQTGNRNQRLAFLDHIKAFALLWVVLNHLVERWFGLPFAGNPDSYWPAFPLRVAQWQPLTTFGFLNIPLTAIRSLGWLGDQGVTVFLIISGFALTWGCLQTSDRSSSRWSSFLQRRVARIYPTWLTAHLLFLFPLAILGWHLSLLDSELYFSLIGIRILPNELYYGVSSWWYVPLLLQLYLVFPFLYRLLQRAVLTNYFTQIFLTTMIGCLLVRLLGLLFFTTYLDAWNRGALFLSRLPEFMTGVGIAFYSSRQAASVVFSRPTYPLIGLVLTALGIVASFSLAGMAVAPLCIGGGVLLMIFPLTVSLGQSNSRLAQTLAWIGRHSFSLFLVHQLAVRALVRPLAGSNQLLSAVVRLSVVLVASLLLALLLERSTYFLQTRLGRFVQRWGLSGFSWRLAGGLAVVWCALIASELYIRSVDPQETADLGWGERPSLQPDSVLGWKLRPSSSTRLRWQGYNYTVTSNALGFPGPDPPSTADSTVSNILVTGDAFSSAEGVDTAASWPRLLEGHLHTHSKNVHVLDFAVTGYGPNQYQQVVSQYAPAYKPKLLIVELFDNDFADAVTTNAEFQRSIGFARPNATGWAGILTFRQLSTLIRQALLKIVFEQVLGRPDPQGYTLGGFHFIERDNLDPQSELLVAQRLSSIRQTADRIQAHVLAVLVPSAAQVCRPGSRAYWPKHVDLNDQGKFDRDLPQRTFAGILTRLSIPYIDLLPIFKAKEDQGVLIYQNRNMHWTAAGHQAAAQTINGFIKDHPELIGQSWQ